MSYIKRFLEDVEYMSGMSQLAFDLADCGYMDWPDFVDGFDYFWLYQNEKHIAAIIDVLFDFGINPNECIIQYADDLRNDENCLKIVGCCYHKGCAITEFILNSKKHCFVIMVDGDYDNSILLTLPDNEGQSAYTSSTILSY